MSLIRDFINGLIEIKRSLFGPWEDYPYYFGPYSYGFWGRI